MQKHLGSIKKILTIFGTILALLLMVMATVIYFSIQWMFDTWSNLTMDELVYHLAAPLEGTNEAMIREYLSRCIVPAILVLVFAVILFIVWRRKKNYFIFMGAGMILSLTVSVCVVHGAWNKLDAGNYMEAQGRYSTFIDDNYVDPSEVTLSFPEKKRNLIYIFLESMETTYADTNSGGAFKKNVIPELTELAKENEDFSGENSELNGGYAMPGTTWTMGAMFAQTSGLPLNISIEGNSMDTQDKFFNNVITLGDILDNVGYKQILLIGSDATFGGRRLYFSKHGNYEIIDYEYAKKAGMIPEEYKVWWGYEDQKLFAFAKEKLEELASSGEPFNLTMLTADTHFEDGFSCSVCRKVFRDNQYANVMACSSRQLKEFIEWVQQQSFYDNTTIVLVGDHPTMDSDFCEDVESDYLRKVYTSFINSHIETKIDKERNYTTFDFFPTTLAALGIQIDGEHLGLGTNLFSDKQTLTERFGRDYEEEELKKNSELLEEFASLDESKQELLIREGKNPKADITVGEYEEGLGVIPVSVSKAENVSNGVANIMLAVWTDEIQGDLKWISMQIQEDSSYYVHVDTASFGNKMGKYHIQAYVIDGAGDQYMVAETMAIIER